jgi:photosystem II stability/assembly factor-like uncharacterized protein
MKYRHTKKIIIPLLASTLLAASCSLFNLGGGQNVLGIAKTDNGGADWQFKNPIKDNPEVSLAGTTISKITFLPGNPEVLFAGSYDGGIFKSENSGDSWFRILSKIAVYDLVINPLETTELYASGIFGDHGKVLKSTDSGKSWLEIYSEESSQNTVRAITVNPANPQELLIGLSSGNLNRSVDGGATWQAVTSLQDRINQLLWRGDTIYLLTQTKGLFSSTNNGQSFQNISGNLIASNGTFNQLFNQRPVNTFNRLAVSSLTNGLLYLTTDAGLYRTTNNGGSWQVVPLPLAMNNSNPILAIAIAETTDNTVYTSAGPTVYKTTNAGQSWQTHQIATQAFINAILIHPLRPQIAYVGFYQIQSSFGL